MSQKNTIVAMPTTIVVIWSTTIVATPITIVVIFSKNFWLCKHYCMVQAWSFLRLSWSQPHFSQYCCYFALLNSTIYTFSIQFECWKQIWLYLLYFSTMFAINCTNKLENFQKMEFVDKLTMIPKFCKWNLHTLLCLLILIMIVQNA